MDISKIVPHLEVKIKQSNKHVATVDHMDGANSVKLTRKDSADGKHHWIPLSLVSEVDDTAIYLNCSDEEFLKHLSTTNLDTKH